MATRSVVVRLEAEVSKFVQGQEKARKATRDTAKAQEDLGKVVDQAAGKSEKASDRVVKGNRKQAQSFDETVKSAEKAGTALLAFGTLSVAGLGASAKAAMDWESAWAGVTKTVDGTPEQMAALEGELRGLAKTLPLSHTEIAAVAEAAGQLGVKRKDVVAFTKTMIDLGETTNLTADEAATNIAQIANVMGTAGQDIDNFGATLVALGNDGASTEKEILDMAQRIAGAGKLVGASESDVLALANTLASVGVESQLGGGVVSRVLQRMYADVKTGGEGLQELAKVSGISSKQFAAAFEADPVRAMDMVVKGLGAVKESGGNVVQTMEDLGIKGTEETSVILRLAGAGDLLTESLDLGSKAWKENVALANEAAKRYDTTESKVAVAWNNIKDAAIDAGAVLLPMIQTVAETVSGLAQSFGNLPEPVKGLLTTMGGIATVTALAGGAFINLAPKVRDAVSAFKDLDTRANGSSRGLRDVGKAAGIAAIAATAASAAIAALADLANKNDKHTSVEQFNNALVGVSEHGERAKKALDGAFNGVSTVGAKSMFTEVNDLDSALKRVFNPNFNDNMNDFWSTVSGQNASSGMNKSKAALGDLDKSIASLAQSGNGKDAAAAFKLVAEQAKAQGKNVEDLIPLFPQYADAMRKAKTEGGQTQISQQDLARAMLEGGTAAQDAAGKQALLDKAIEETGVSVDGVVESMDKFLEQLFQAGILTMSSRDAAAAYQDRIDSVAGAVKEIAESGGKMGATLTKNKADFDLTTEAGRLANETFQGLARDGMAEVEAMAAEGAGQGELQKKLNTTYTDLVNVGKQFGLSKEAAEKLAQSILGVPEGVNVNTWMSYAARQEAEKTKAAVDAIPAQKSVDVFFNNHHTEFFENPKGANLGAGQRFAGFAGGGDLDSAPGPKGVDSKLFYGAKGEHVLTASEVDLMGGQSAVYKFRSDLRAGRITSHASGGEVGVSHYMPSASLARFATSAARNTERPGMKQEINFHGAPGFTREQYETFAVQRLNQENRRET